jgi:hypothetical protein
MRDAEAVMPPRRGDYRILTCIMPSGHGTEVADALRREAGVIDSCVHHARGIGTHSLHHRVYSDEKQILTALVEAAHADDVFHFLYHRAGLDQPHAGMLLMSRAFRGAGSPPADDATGAAGAAG